MSEVSRNAKTNELSGCALSNCIVFRDTDNDDDSFGSCACLWCKSHSEYNACLYIKRDFLLFFAWIVFCFCFFFIFYVYVHNSLRFYYLLATFFFSLNIFDFMYSVLSVRFYIRLCVYVCLWMWCGFCVLFLFQRSFSCFKCLYGSCFWMLHVKRREQ